jgi:hypothetical protein
MAEAPENLDAARAADAAIIATIFTARLTGITRQALASARRAAWHDRLP